MNQGLSSPRGLPNQAIASAGGPKLLRGRVEFLRFTQEGATDRRIFGYNPKAFSGDHRNPVLMPGDVVRINESLVSASLEFVNEITALQATQSIQSIKIWIYDRG